MTDTDRIRLAEAFRVAARIGNSVWSGWSKAPFAVDLITSEYEFLVGHPDPPAEFKRLKEDAGRSYDALVKNAPQTLAKTQPFSDMLDAGLKPINEALARNPEANSNLLGPKKLP